MTRNENLPFQLESAPLEISTVSIVGSGDEVAVFFSSQMSLAGGVVISLTPYPTYHLPRCDVEKTYFTNPLPSGSGLMVFRITKEHISPVSVGLVIHCNDKEVASVLLTHSSCHTEDWIQFWTKDTAYIEFESFDKASYFYREYKPPGNLD